MQIAFKLKTIPSDFIVEEITPEKEIITLGKTYSFDAQSHETRFRHKVRGLCEFQAVSTPSAVESKGKFLHFILQKENRDTLEVLDEIARKLHTPREVLSIAGMKDKEAITAQMASAYQIRKEHLETLKIRGAKLIPLRYSDRKVFLGNLWGNRFTITLRDIAVGKENLQSFIESHISEMHGFFPNYFGGQRFGDDNSTQKIGKLILKSDFKAAAKECADRYRECAAHLKRHPKDYIGAIKQLPQKLQKMFIHAVQAEIFNAALNEIIAQKIRDNNIEIPLPGYRFSSRIFTSEIDKIAEKIMKKEGLAPEMFRIKELPEISSEGELRRAFEEFYDFKIIAIENDELHAGKTKAVVQFALKKGCYATVFLSELFNITHIML